jgi:glucuronokinase
LVYMDFSKERGERIHGFACGEYEPLCSSLLPPLYIAYKTSISEPTEVIHNDLRARFNRGEPAVIEAMRRFAQMTIEARQAILDADIVKLNRLINQNFDLRRSICRLPAEQVEMVERARKVGATAKFTGSGGAIVGTYADDQTFDRLENELSTLGCQVLRLSTG